MKEKQRLGIYGGTFSPPHIGHVRAAEAFSEAVKPNKFLIMPDFLPPHKVFDGEASTEDRIKMCELAFSHITGAEISNMEILRGGKSYTVVTLRELYDADTELYFLCGTDMFLSLERWYEFKEIFERAVICYVKREHDFEIDRELYAAEEKYKSLYGAKIIRIPSDIKEISSTDLRAALKCGEDTSLYLTEGVRAYICEKGLYH